MKLLSIAAFALVATVSTFARDLTVSTNGTGAVERSGVEDNNVAKANLILEANGDFTIGLVGNVDYRFKGTAQSVDRDTMRLNVTSAFGKDAAGTGTLILDDRRTGPVVGKVSLAGNGRAGSFKARFQGEREAFIQVPGVTRPQQAPPLILVDSLRGGSGNMRISGQAPYKLSHVYVSLKADGSALVNIYGEATAGYVGTWLPAGPNTYQLSVRGGFAGERISGAVTIAPGGRTYSRVELSGTSLRVYYSFAFEPNR